MKKILYLLLLFPILLAAQSTSLLIHEEFENSKGATSFTFSKTILDAMDITTEDENGNKHRITGDLHKVKFLNFNNEKPTNYISEIDSLFAESKYENVDLDESEDVALYIERKGKRISEVHILIVESQSNSLISFYGNLKADELCSISTALQINTCKHLKHIK